MQSNAWTRQACLEMMVLVVHEREKTIYACFFFIQGLFFHSLLSLLDLGRAPEIFLLSVKMHFYDNYNNGK